MLVMLLLSVGNFFSSTTTPKSHILLVLFRFARDDCDEVSDQSVRALCDIANILHAVILTLLCIWSDGMRANGERYKFYRIAEVCAQTVKLLDGFFAPLGCCPFPPFHPNQHLQ